MITAMAQLGACATQPSLPAPSPPRAGAEAAALADRARQLTSMQTSAVMEYSGPNGHLKARERIALRRPGNLRVEALSPMGVALVVAADAHQIAVFDPGEHTIARGPATAATLDRVAQIPLQPERAVSLLLGLPPDPALLAGPPSSVSDNGDTRTLSYRGKNGSIDTLIFTAGTLGAVREQAADGVIAFEVHYGDYRDIGAIEFPHTVEATFPAAATTIKLRYESPLVDSVIPDADFVLSPSPEIKELTLSRIDGPPVV
jgi:outer membrane lipoprotein-sorting protein